MRRYGPLFILALAACAEHAPSETTISPELAVCRSVFEFSAALSYGGYLDSPPYTTPYDYTYAAITSAAVEPYDVMTLEVHHHTAASPLNYPLVRTFSPMTTISNCDACIVLYTGCTIAGCSRMFIAQGGSVWIDRADVDPIAGSIRASADSLFFVEWIRNGVFEGPAIGGQCIELAHAAFDVSWGGTSCGHLGEACCSGFVPCYDDNTCDNGTCTYQCIPDCTGAVCGSDGCGGWCGPDCAAGEVCDHGACVCDPQCGNHQCGADACGGTCGTCGNEQVCQENGYCCTNEGTFCAIDSHCCSGICNFTAGVCDTCRGWGSPCSDDAECCTGQCFDGSCVGI